MSHANEPAADQLATARTPDERLVIAVLDPESTETNSPLRRALAHIRPDLIAPPTSQKEA